LKYFANFPNILKLYSVFIVINELLMLYFQANVDLGIPEKPELE